MNKNIHVVKKDGVWKVKQENCDRSSGNFTTQGEAIKRAVEIAKNNRQEVIIHRPNGIIREKNGYGNDPFPPVG